MWVPLTGATDPIFPGKTGDLITVRVVCSSLSFHSGIAHFSGMQKFAAPFVGAPFSGAPVRPNMLNMPKSASVNKLK